MTNNNQNNQNNAISYITSTDSIPTWYTTFKKDFVDNENIAIFALTRESVYYHIIANKRIFKWVTDIKVDKSNLDTYKKFINLTSAYSFPNHMSYHNNTQYLFVDLSKSDLKNGIYYGFVRKLGQFANPNHKTNISDFSNLNLIHISKDPTVFHDLTDNVYDNFNEDELKELFKVSVKINKHLYYLDTFKQTVLVRSMDFIDMYLETGFWKYEEYSQGFKALEAYLKQEDLQNNNGATTYAIEEEMCRFYFQDYFYTQWKKKVKKEEQNALKRVFVKTFLLRVIYYYLNEVETDLSPKQSLELINHIINNYIQQENKPEVR